MDVVNTTSNKRVYSAFTNVLKTFLRKRIFSKKLFCLFFLTFIELLHLCSYCKNDGYNDDHQSQWERLNFDPQPTLNPLTDRHQIMHNGEMFYNVTVAVCRVCNDIVKSVYRCCELSVCTFISTSIVFTLFFFTVRAIATDCIVFRPSFFPVPKITHDPLHLGR